MVVSFLQCRCIRSPSLCACVCRRSRTYARTTCTTTRRHRLLLFAMDCINSPPNEIWSPRENADSAVAAREILSPSGTEENVPADSRTSPDAMSILFRYCLSVNTIDTLVHLNSRDGTRGFHPASRPCPDQLPRFNFAGVASDLTGRPN